MHLLVELVQQPPIQDAGVLFLGANDYGVGFFDRGKISAVGRNDLVGYASLQDFSKFFALLGIRPQYEDRLRHS